MHEWRFYFPRLKSGMPILASTFDQAYQEVMFFLTVAGLKHNCGDVQVFMDDRLIAG